MIGRGAAVAQVKGVGAARQARVRGLARRARRADDRRQQPGRRVQELGERLLRQGAGAQALDRSGTPRMEWEEDESRPRRRPREVRGMSTTRLRRHHHRQRRRRRDARGHLAPSGKRVLILERGDWLPREIENWDADEVFVKNRYVAKDTWYDDDGKPLPAAASTTTSAARRSSTAPRCTGSGSEDFGELRHHDGISPAWPISYDELRAVLHAGRAAVRGPRQRTARTRPRARERAVPVPGRVPRAADPAAVRRPRAGRLPPVPRPVRRPAATRRPGRQPVHPLRDLRRLPVPRPGASPTPRCSASARPSSIRTSRC